jgi:hypothetical protein
MKILPLVVFFHVCFFSLQLSFGQDTKLQEFQSSDSLNQGKMSDDSASIQDSLNALAVRAHKDSVRAARAVRDSIRAVKALADSIRKDSVKRHWRGWTKYQIQPGHIFSLYSKGILKGKSKKELQYNIADFYLYLNGQLIRPPKAGNNFFAAGCLCFKYDDTLLLNSGLGSKVGVGVGIKIIDGRFTGSLHANTHNAEIYKLSKDDSVYVKNIITNPVSQTLKLRSRPTQAANGIITGEYQASYKKFYQKNDEDTDELRRYTVRIVFRCRVSGGIDSIKSPGGVDSK